MLKKQIFLQGSSEIGKTASEILAAGPKLGLILSEATADSDLPDTEQELQGRLAGFISTLDPSIEVLTEYPIDHASGRVQVDILLKKGEHAIILELKKPSYEYHRKAINAKEQLRHYLLASKLKYGIVYAPVLRTSTKTEIEEYSISVPDGELKVVILTPAISNA